MESAGTMPKHNTRNLDFQPVEKVPPPLEQVGTVSIVCMIDAVVKATGLVTGNHYLFSGAGSVVDVDKKDVQWLLEKRQGERQCCGGGGGGNVIFALASES